MEKVIFIFLGEWVSFKFYITFWVNMWSNYPPQVFQNMGLLFNMVWELISNVCVSRPKPVLYKQCLCTLAGSCRCPTNSETLF